MYTWSKVKAEILNMKKGDEATYPYLGKNDISLIHFFNDPIEGLLNEAEIIANNVQVGTFTVRRK